MRFRQVWAPVVAVSLLFGSGFAGAQGPRARLAAAIDSGATSARVTLPGTRPAQAAHGVDEGALPSSTALKGITLVFRRSEAQQADLDGLLAAQQDTTSPLYHQWLTPDQFAARFGVADADLSKVQTWLQGQGFSVDGVTRSRDRITFDGTAGQVARAFGAELHKYGFPDGSHFAPANDLSVPAVLAPMTTTVLHLADFHPHAQKRLMPAAVRPAYTSSQTGNHFLTPSDLATMYDIKTTYNAGFNGAGQAIAILGQSYIDTSAIAAFQAGAGIATNLPTLVLVSNTGVPGVNVMEDGDEGESQLDVEYASGMAPGATVFLVYTGDNPNSNGIFDSLTQAVTENIAPVISGSYGFCETDLQAQGASGSQFAANYNQLLQEANAQGQTVLFSSGDSGSTTCYGDTNVSATQQKALATDFPASIPNVTAMGGAQMQAGTFASTNTQYWQSATGTDVIGSLLSYVPEAAWNEDSSSTGISAGGGGVSVLFSRPSWQAGVTGIPAGTTRLVPDLALQASVQSPGFIYCTSDPSDLSSEGLAASCTNGLRSTAGTFAVAGGTSFATPIFAGMLAVLNQAKNAVGQGNINPILYGLAANATNYGSAFHDITTGTIACTAGTTFCSTVGASQYPATVGYDEATGLGSVDFGKLLAVWPAPATTGTAPQFGSRTTLSAATTTPASGATDVVTIRVSPVSSTGATPTGTVVVAVDGGSTTTTLPLTNGSATYTWPGSTAAGSHVLVAQYSGDPVTLPSRGTLALTLAGSTTPSGTFSLAAQNISVAYNGLANGSVTITPAMGYTGTVVLSLSYPANAPTLCYQTTPNLDTAASNFSLANGAAAGVLTLGEGTNCTGTATGAVVLKGGQKIALVSRPQAPSQPGRSWPAGAAFAGVLFVGLAFRRKRNVPALLSVLLLTGVGLGLSGCGGNSGTSTTGPISPINQTQTFTVTLQGVDSVNSSITSSTTLTVTVHP